MPLRIACSSCHARLKVPSKLVQSGKPLNCPKCKALVTLPSTVPDDEYDVEPVVPRPIPSVASVVSCPHCRGQLQNEPSLAGQQVTCPYPACGGQFLMPPLASDQQTHPTLPGGVGSVRVTVFAQPGQAYGHTQPDAGAVVVLIPDGRQVSVPWPALLPGNWNLHRQLLPRHLQNVNLSQAQALLRQSGGNAAVVGVDGRAVLPSIQSGEYHLLILSNTKPSSTWALSVREKPHLTPGFDTGERLLDRYFGLGDIEEHGVRTRLRDNLGHEGAITVLPGEETEYSFTFRP